MTTHSLIERRPTKPEPEPLLGPGDHSRDGERRMSDYVEPPDVANLVRDYVEKAHLDDAEYDNSSPLDTGGTYSLHRLAAEIYAKGWAAGHVLGYEQGYAARRQDEVATTKRPLKADKENASHEQ